MTGILKKDLLAVVILLIVFLPFTILYWSITRESLDLMALFLQTGYSIGIVMLVILIAEKQEMKNNGYLFLVTLPLKTRDIVAARFILIFILIFVFTSTSSFFFAGLASTGAESNAAYIVLVSGAVAGLLMGGAVQTLAYRFGARKMIVPIVMLATVGYMGPVFVDELLVERGAVTIGSLIELTEGINLWGLMGAGIVCYFLIAQGAVKVFRSYGADNA